MKRSLKKKLRTHEPTWASPYNLSEQEPIRGRSIVPPWLQPTGYMTRDSFLALVGLSAHGYRPHLVFGEREPHHVVAHAVGFVPPSVLRAVREEIQDYLPVALLADTTATDCGHDDCREYAELGRACYDSTHCAAL